MPPLTVALTPAQVAEFAALVQQERDAQRTIDLAPVARNYAARAIVLGQFPLAIFDGKNLHIDLDAAMISFEPNAALPSLVSDAPQETVS